MSATTHTRPNGGFAAERFQRFADVIKSQLGIKMPAAKASMLQSRLQRRMRALELDTLEEYEDYLFHSPDAEKEYIHFIDVVTTNKTDFYREPTHFDFLLQHGLPSLDTRPGLPWNFKLWCAGCSTGEEPYTLAMELSEYALQRERFSFSILGTDISSRVLETAKAAVYSEDKIAPVPMRQRQRYLTRSREPQKALVRIAPALRQRVEFERVNFMEESYPIRDSFDAIFLRNVLIYFDRPTQESVVGKLCRHLKPGGLLFIGHSESLAGMALPLSLVSSAVFRKIGAI